MSDPAGTEQTSGQQQQQTPPNPPPNPAPLPTPPPTPPTPKADDTIGQQVLTGVQALPERFVSAMREAFPGLNNPAPTPPTEPVKPKRRTLGEWYFGQEAPKGKAS